jgi:uncharacterized protein (TIGR00106 family)
MCTCSITIVPMGETTSISDILTRCIKVLDDYPELEHEVTPMSTQIGGPLDQILEAVEDMHEAAFEDGAARVYTIITLDDRRDKEQALEDKVAVIEEKLGV